MRASAFATGEQLKLARTFADLTQPELAEATGVHVNTISKYESLGALKDTGAIRKLTDFLLEGRGANMKLDDIGVLTIII